MTTSDGWLKLHIYQNYWAQTGEMDYEELDGLQYQIEKLRVDHIDGLCGFEECAAIKVTNKEANELIREIKRFKKVCGYAKRN